MAITRCATTGIIKARIATPPTNQGDGNSRRLDVPLRASSADAGGEPGREVVAAAVLAGTGWERLGARRTARRGSTRSATSRPTALAAAKERFSVVIPMMHVPPVVPKARARSF